MEGGMLAFVGLDNLTQNNLSSFDLNNVYLENDCMEFTARFSIDIDF